MSIAPSQAPTPPSTTDSSFRQETLERAPVVGNFQVMAPMSRSKRGSLYLGSHVHIGNLVAIKMLRTELLGDEQIIQRFLREAITSSTIRHPNVVGIIDCGVTDGGVTYVVMDLLQGDSLSTRLYSGRLDVDWCIELACQLASALAAVHAAGVVHHDLRPSAIRIIPGEQPGNDRAVLVDFGVAKFVGDASSDGPKLGGAAAYTSPEQFLGITDSDPRSDIYALGCLLHHMLTGTPPFVGTPERIVEQHLHAARKSIRRRRPELPPELDLLLNRMLQVSADHRPQSMAEVHAELSALRRSRVSRAATVAAPTRPGVPRSKLPVIIAMSLLAITAICLGCAMILTSNDADGDAGSCPPGSSCATLQEESRTTTNEALAAHPDAPDRVSGPLVVQGR
jgi:serine/threonine-protein kinase